MVSCGSPLEDIVLRTAGAARPMQVSLKRLGPRRRITRPPQADYRPVPVSHFPAPTSPFLTTL